MVGNVGSRRDEGPLALYEAGQEVLRRVAERSDGSYTSGEMPSVEEVWRTLYHCGFHSGSYFVSLGVVALETPPERGAIERWTRCLEGLPVAFSRSLRDRLVPKGEIKFQELQELYHSTVESAQ